MNIKGFLKQHIIFLIILLFHLILASSYASLIPLGEAPDEAAHLAYARFIAKNGRLPATLQEREAAGYRAAWPPLYHFLVAAPLAIVGDTPPTRLKSVGDTPRRLIPTNGQTIAVFIHTDDEAWPWRGITLAWHLGRFVSVILMALAVCATYAIAWRLTHRRLLATAAAALHAFLPQALFIGSAINDDNLLIFLSGLIFLTLVNYTQRPAPPGLVRFFFLGALLGLATITKYNALPLWPIVIIWTFWLTFPQDPFRTPAPLPPRPPAPLHPRTLAPFLALLTGAALTGGWWFIFVWRTFNQIDTQGFISGSLAALSAGAADASLRQLTRAASITLPPLAAWLEWSATLFQSFWGLFGGGGTIELPSRLYWLLAAICLLAIGSLISASRYAASFKWERKRGGPPPKSPGLRHFLSRLQILNLKFQISNTHPSSSNHSSFIIYHSLFTILIPLFFLPLPLLRFLLSNNIVETAQGRHLFPALPFISLGLAWGLSYAFNLAVDFGIRALRQATFGCPHHALRITPSNLWLTALRLTSFLPILALSLYSLNLILSSYPPPIPLRTIADAAGIENQLQVNLAEGVTLIGYQLGRPKNGALPVTLLWQADSIPSEDYLIDLTLTDSTGQPIGSWVGYPIGGRYPTRAWDQGDILRDAISLPLLPNLPSTKATLTLRLLNANHQPTTNPITLTSIKQVTSSYPPAPPLPCSPAQLRADNLPPDAPFTYRNTLSFILPNQTAAPTLIAPDGQTFAPTQFLPGLTGSIAHFIVAPNWPSGNYQLTINNEQLSIGNYQLSINNRRLQFDPPAMTHALNANFANHITLLGYDLPQRRVRPGQSFPLTLHLRAERALGQNLVIFNHLLDQNAVQRGGVDRIPQQYYTTLLWVPGEIVSDAYDVPVDPAAPPGIYRLDVGLYPDDNPAFSLPLFIDGHPIDRTGVTLGPIKVGGPLPGVVVSKANPQTPLNISFGNQITLLGFDLLDSAGNPIVNPKSKIQSLKLYWQPTTIPATDYTVFVHILNSAGNLAAQADSPPAAGAYPTSLWDPGEIIADERPLPDLPPGRYTLYAGLYRPDTGERLPSPGILNGAVKVMEFEVGE